MVTTEKNEFQKKPSGYKVAPLNKLELRRIATGFRAILKEEGCYSNSPIFLDVTKVLESVLFRAGYNLHVLPDEELTETAAFTIPERQLIVLRQSVYDSLDADDPFARYTVIHEFSHIALSHSVTLHRNAELGKHEWYEDSEWQANNLTAEILMPVEVVKNLKSDANLVAKECGVSNQAATIRIKNLHKENVL